MFSTLGNPHPQLPGEISHKMAEQQEATANFFNVSAESMAETMSQQEPFTSPTEPRPVRVRRQALQATSEASVSQQELAARAKRAAGEYLLRKSTPTALSMDDVAMKHGAANRMAVHRAVQQLGGIEGQLEAAARHIDWNASEGPTLTPQPLTDQAPTASEPVEELPSTSTAEETYRDSGVSFATYKKVVVAAAKLVLEGGKTCAEGVRFAESEFNALISLFRRETA